MLLVFGSNWDVESKVFQCLAQNAIEARAFVTDRKKARWLDRLTGIEIYRSNAEGEESIRRALVGVDTVLLIMGYSGVAIGQGDSLIGSLIEAGVNRVISVSGFNFITGPDSALLMRNEPTEQSLISSKIDYTVIRCSTYMESFLFQAYNIARNGFFVGNIGNGRLAPVDTCDVARLLTSIAVEKGHERKVYHVSGPEALTFKEIAATMSSAIGKRVRYRDTPGWLLKTLLSRNPEMPDWYVRHGMELQSLIKKHPSETVTETLERLGKFKPTTFEQFVKNYSYIFIGRKDLEKQQRP